MTAPSTAVPPRTIYRVARREKVWDWPEWAAAGPDRTFGNRFDDCEGLYRVLYTATRPYGCYLETLARFRPSLTFYAELAAITGEIDYAAPGIVDLDWRNRRRIGDANITGSFADVGSSPWISNIRQHLAAETLAAGFDDFDAHALYSTAPRTLTQQISRLVFDNQCDGIRYVSKYGLDAECWALFDGRVIITDDDEHEISVDDPDLQAAMHVHALTFDSTQPL